MIHHRELLLEAALSYARKGWKVFPVHSISDSGTCSCGGQEACSPGKHPRTDHGFKDATTDERTIREWWKRWPDANIGISTGAESGIVVLDVDPRHGGDESLTNLVETHGPIFPTITSLTGSGGSHFYYEHPGPGKIVKNVVEFASMPGLDVRGDGGYVVAPPSLHASMRRYEWKKGYGPGDVPAAPLPEWMLPLIAEKSRRGDGPSLRCSRGSEPIAEGLRNQTLARIAGRLRRQGLSEAAIGAELLEINEQRCKPPLSKDEVLRIAHSIAQYPPGPPDEQRQFPLTELKNAERLVAQHGRNLHYVPDWKEWLVWDGMRFVRDGLLEVERRAKETVRSLYEEAADLEDDDQRMKLLKHIKSSETDRAMKAMIALARAEPGIAISPKSLDADPWLLNVQNGTLDLRTGRLRPHDRGDLITKLVPIAYDPKATCPLWTSFLERVLPDPELRRFVQKLAGYALTGDTTEEKFFFVYGPAASGKSTFTQALKNTIGDYSMVADFEAFLKRTNVGGPRNDIARLAGSRFVLSVEVDQGQHLAEALVKLLTGGDTVSARFLHKESFEFDPQCKLFLVANHRPQVRDDDDAIWRRICVVPFAVSIPECERDPSVKQRLSDPTFAGAAILAWAVEGCLEWQDERLGAPPAIREATEEYRAEVDRVTGFLDEYCVFRSDAWTAAKSLREAYDSWCRENGVITPLNAREIADRLKARGCIQRHRERARGWLGIGLRTDSE